MRTPSRTGVTFGLYATIDELADGAELRQFFEHARPDAVAARGAAPPP